MRENYSEPLYIGVPEGDKEQIEQYAEEQGMSLSAAVRRLIDRGLTVEKLFDQDHEDDVFAD